ncbi:hypothetical protein BDZ94DRAFT_1234573 [Collybia nuda]|uniref:DUF7888 domain-containing protein n=1 Tax=Collybia nuda TaxID=64659 RepID=A0A9P6CGL7_9AGAR|nr:hypothetical protein BDZ94DRAFT_1234573 [Collybia nuda]
MQLSFARSILFALCSLMVVTRAMPSYYNMDADVEVRALPISEADMLEARRGGIGDVVEIIMNVVGSIKAGIAQDKKNRGNFTQKLVGDMRAKSPQFNWVICHTKHKTAFDGTRGKDWGHSHQEFDVKIGGTVGYEIYYFKSGKFTRQGDGGFLNWAYIGNVKSKSSDGKEITFGAP